MFFPLWLVDLYPLKVDYWKTLNLHRKFQFIGNYKIVQYFVTIVRLHLQCLEFHIKIHGMAGKQCAFFCPKGWKRSLLTFWLECQLSLCGHPAGVAYHVKFGANQ